MQHGVRIEAVFASLQQGEHIVESMQFPAYIQSSRQVQQFYKQNYFQRRGERRYPRRDTSIFEYSVSTYNPAFYKNSVFPHAIQSSRAKKTILHTELILLQEFSKKYYNYKAHPMHINTRHPPATVSHASKHSTWQNQAPSTPRIGQVEEEF